MAERRRDIPRELARAVKVEAGHRCAVPTCRQTSGLEIHHIVNYSIAQVHEFDNLILLCAICHARATKGEIDRKAMKAYKANLRTINGRYGDLERRVLDHFVRHPDAESITLDRSHELLVSFLVEDGLLEQVPGFAKGAVWIPTHDGDQPLDGDTLLGPTKWRLTEDGKTVVSTLRSNSHLN